jgi:folate-binding protein YgfZ
MSSLLRSAQAERGARFVELAGAEVARHYGEPAAEYEAVRTAVGIAVRSDLAPLRMWGRDPVKMMHGLVTNDVTAITAGQGLYATMLTPKGRVIAEMRIFQEDREEPGLTILLPREALEGTSTHLRKFVPPMFARWRDASAEVGVIGVYGPRAAELLEEVLGRPLPRREEEAATRPAEEEDLLVVFTREAGGEPGFELVAATERLPRLWEHLLTSAAPRGGRPVGFGTLETLRVEAGRPRYGAELTEETIPTEAFEAIGWMPRAISFTKGCYTGQEVIVRIAHRGHVNRHLRGLALGDSPTPAPRTPLFNPETGKEIGWVTSAAVSPRAGQTIALAFVRRELSPGDPVRLQSLEGPAARVVELPFSAVEV